jgi:hypothetical protein
MPGPYDQVLQGIRAKYPPLQRHPFSIINAAQDNPEAYSEFYPAWEEENPQPGQHTIEAYSKLQNSPHQEDLITGEMLHLLGGETPQGAPVDPEYQKMKQSFIGAFSPEQLAEEHQQHQDPNRAQWVQGRPFNQYMDQSRGDAYIRAGLFPKANPNWGPDSFNPQQQVILNNIKKYLTSYPGTVPPEEGLGR